VKIIAKLNELPNWNASFLHTLFTPYSLGPWGSAYSGWGSGTDIDNNFYNADFLREGFSLFGYLGGGYCSGAGAPAVINDYPPELVVTRNSFCRDTIVFPYAANAVCEFCLPFFDFLDGYCEPVITCRNPVAFAKNGKIQLWLVQGVHKAFTRYHYSNKIPQTNSVGNMFYYTSVEQRNLVVHGINNDALANLETHSEEYTTYDILSAAPTATAFETVTTAPTANIQSALSCHRHGRIYQKYSVVANTTNFVQYRLVK
jgi:hypothetical protein